MPRLKQLFSLILAISCIFLSLQVHVQGQQAEPDELKVAKDQTFLLELLSPISTATNQKGDSFSCRVTNEGFYKDALVSGYIKKLKRSGKANGKAEIDLAFDSVTIADGRSGSFNAQIVEVYELEAAGNGGKADPEGTVKAKSRVKVSVKRAVAGAIVGGIIGGVIAGGQGAAVGAAIGAGLAVTSTLVTDGPDLEFKQGTQFKVLTNAPGRREKREKPAAADNKQTPVAVITPAPSNTGSTPVETAAKVLPPAAVQSPPVVKEEIKVKETPALAPLPLTVKPPRPPSTRQRVYTGGTLFRLSVPANWRESASENPVTFAPEGGYVSYQGKLVLVYGLRVGFVSSQDGNLQNSTAQLISALSQEKSNLIQNGGSRNIEIAKRPFLATTFSGKSTATGQAEVINVYSTMLHRGDLFYIVTVVPQSDSASYQTFFQNILLSLQLND